MSLWKRGSIWWSSIEVNKKRKQFSTRCTNYNKAVVVESARRTSMVMEQEKARLTPPAAPTLNTFSTRFINSLFGGRVARETRRFYICHWKPLLEYQPLCECELDKISLAIVEDFVQFRRKQDVSVTTINHNLRTLRRSLHLAQEWDLISKVPKIRLLPGEKQREFVLTDEAVDGFAAEEGIIGKLVPFLVDVGLRRSELTNLQWESGVNLKERFVYVMRGKTKYARRKITLTQRAEKILLDLKARRTDSPYVFTLARGRTMCETRDARVTNDYVSHEFLRVRRKLKLPDDCVLHSTRHTFCTRLGEKGASAFQIQRLAGHSSIVISQRYVHPGTDQLDAAIALLG